MAEETGGAALLAKGYVEATVRVKQGQDDVNGIFREIGTQASRAADDTGQTLHAGIVGGLTAAGKDGAKELDRGIVGGIKASSPGWRQTIADGLLAGMAENGDKAADSFRGHFVTGLAQGLQSDGGGIFAGLLGRARDAGDEGGRSLSEGLGGGLDAVSGKSKAAGEALEGLGIEGGAVAGSLGGITEALAGIVTDPVVLATAAVVGLGAAAFEVLHKLDELGESWESTFDKIAVQTGANEEQLKGYEDTVTAIAGNISQPIDKIGSDVADVAQKFGDSGAGLASVTTEVGRLQSVVGNFDIKSVGEVVRANNLDATQQTGLLNDLLHAYQANGDPIDTFSAALARVTPVAKELNLSTRDTLGILTSLSAAGVDPSKGVQALNTAAEKAVKSGQPLNGFLQKTIAQIKQLHDQGDEQGADKLADSVFGGGIRGGGAGIVSAIDQGKLASDDLTASLDHQGQTLDQLYEKTKHAGGAWQEVKNSIVAALGPASASLHKVIDQDLEGLSGWIGAHKHDIVGFFVDIGVAAVNMASFTVDAFGQLAQGLGQLLGPIATTLSAFGSLADAVGAHGVADDLNSTATSFSKAGDGLNDFGGKMRTFAADEAPKLIAALEGARSAADVASGAIGGAAGKAFDFGSALKGIPPKTDAEVTTPGLDDAVTKADHLKGVLDGLKGQGTGTTTQQDTFLGVPLQPWFQRFIGDGPGSPAPNSAKGPAPQITPHRQDGGAIFGAGAKGKDSVVMVGAPGEHVWTADEVDAVGGQQAMYHLRSMAKAGLLKGYSGGGAIGPDVDYAKSLVGTPYSQGARDDCSGMVGRVVNGTLGMEGGLPTTQTMEAWLTAHGFVSGLGGPGTISVGWYNHGNRPNDGHAAMTLSDGEHAESGGSHGDFIVGAGAAGADASEFDHRMHLPNLFGEGSGGSGGVVGGSGSSSGSGAASPAQLSAAQTAVDRATNNKTAAQGKLDADTAAGASAKKLAADQDRLSKATDSVTTAQQKLADLQAKAADGTTSGKNSVPGQLGGIFGDALKENLPPGFSDPTSWPGLKSASALLKFGAGFVKDPTGRGLLDAGASALGGDASGAATDLFGLIPKPFGAIGIGSPGDAPGVGENPTDAGTQSGNGFDPSAFLPNLPHLPSGADMPGDGQTGGNTVDASAHFHGDIGATDAAKQVVAQHSSLQATKLRADLGSKRVLTH